MENIEMNEIVANEIIANEEVANVVTEDIAVDNAGNGLKVAVGIGLATVVGIIVYKKLIKPAIAKHKAKKEAAKQENDNVDIDELFDEE